MVCLGLASVISLAGAAPAAIGTHFPLLDCGSVTGTGPQFHKQCKIIEDASGQCMAQVDNCHQYDVGKSTHCSANSKDTDCAWCVFDMITCKAKYGDDECMNGRMCRNPHIVSTSTTSTTIHAKIEVPTVEINLGVRMPLMMQGTPGAGWNEDTVREAMKMGYIGFDSAYNDPAYDTKPLRNVLKTLKREDFFVTSKIPGPTYTSPAQTEEVLAAALEDLGLDYVDLMLSHSPGQWQNMTVEASLQRHWAGFESFYKSGKARAIGVSNWCPRAIESILKTATVAPHVNQVIYHAGMGEDPDDLMSFSRAHNITIQCESSTDWANKRILTGEPYVSIGQKHNKSALQVALRWLVQRGYPALQGSSNPKHQLENLDLFDFELSEDEVKKISVQRHCRAGNQAPPYCYVPYYQNGETRVCNIDGKGGHASNWECDDHDAARRAFLNLGFTERDLIMSCADVSDMCTDITYGKTAREHCKSTCQQPCQDTVLVDPSDMFRV